MATIAGTLTPNRPAGSHSGHGGERSRRRARTRPPTAGRRGAPPRTSREAARPASTSGYRVPPPAWQ